MKKSIKRIINKRLRKLVGHEIIRTAPTINGGKSHITVPVFLHGFTEKGELIVGYKKGTWHDEFFGTHILAIEYTDKNWMLYRRVFISDNSPLNRWKGKKIRLCKATKNGGISFAKYPMVLVAASKRHILSKLTGKSTDEIITVGRNNSIVK